MAVQFKMQIKDIMRKILCWLFLLFLFYLIYELLRTLFGGSLGFEELVIGLLIANIGYSFFIKESISKLDAKISGHIGWHKGKNSKD